MTAQNSNAVASSFFMSLMFATIFAMGIKGLGPNKKVRGSLLVMSIAGGAIFPPLLGWVAKRTGSYALSYNVPLVAYVVIAGHGFYGRRIRISERRPCDLRHTFLSSL